VKEEIRILVLSGHGHRKHVETLASRNANQIFPGQKVRIAGHSEMFVVLRVDRERHLADLLRHGSVRRVETGIPLALLRPIRKSDEMDQLEVPA
jgi:hypothetical protein